MYGGYAEGTTPREGDDETKHRALGVGLLAIPGTASAKPFSVTQTTIRGAGMEDTLTMRLGNDASRHLTFTLVAKPRVDYANPPTSLGPQYLVTTEFRSADSSGSVSEATQRFYPFAGEAHLSSILLARPSRMTIGTGV